MSHDSARPPKIALSRRRKGAAGKAAPGQDEDAAQDAPQITPIDAARYAGEMAAELARFSRDHDLPTLAYFFEMAHIEAGDEAHRRESEAAAQIKPGRR